MVMQLKQNNLIEFRCQRVWRQIVILDKRVVWQIVAKNPAYICIGL